MADTRYAMQGLKHIHTVVLHGWRFSLLEFENGTWEANGLRFLKGKPTDAEVLDAYGVTLLQGEQGAVKVHQAPFSEALAGFEEDFKKPSFIHTRGAEQPMDSLPNKAVNDGPDTPSRPLHYVDSRTPQVGISDTFRFVDAASIHAVERYNTGWRVYGKWFDHEPTPDEIDEAAKAYAAPKPKAAEVIRFRGQTKLDLNPDDVLEELKGQLDRFVVIGYDKDGEFFFSSTMADGGDVLWCMETAKAELMWKGKGSK